MPTATVSLHIPEPCAESWAAMTPQGTGRHCAGCQEVVIDFTQKTDAEILAILTAAGSGRTCGRFGAQQLERPLQLPLAPRPAWWQTAVAATLALLSWRALAPTVARGQQVRQHPHYSRHSAEPEFRASTSRKLSATAEPAPSLDSALVITGRVLDQQSGDGLPGVTVLLEGTSHGVSTSADGTFSLQVLPEDRHRPLQFSSIGYERLSLPQPVDRQPLCVELKVDAQMLSGEVVVTGAFYTSPVYTPRGLWQRVRSVPWRVRRLFQRD